jgi:hypothetical protein
MIIILKYTRHPIKQNLSKKYELDFERKEGVKCTELAPTFHLFVRFSKFSGSSSLVLSCIAAD